MDDRALPKAVKPRVAFVVRAYPPDPAAPLASGAAKSPYRLIRFLKQFVDVVGVVVADHKGHRSTDVAVEGRPVRWLRLYPRTFIWNLVNAPALVRCSLHADVVQCHHPHFGLVSATLRRLSIGGSRLVVKAHGTAVPEAATKMSTGWRTRLISLSGEIHKRHDRWVLRAADRCIVSSDHQHREMETIYGVNADRLTTIYNGFDPDFRTVRSRPGAEAREAPRLVFVGRPVLKKGLHRVAEIYGALRESHPGATLTLVVGHRRSVEDPVTHRYVAEQLALQPGVRVLFDLDEAGLYQTLAQSDVGLVPSIGYESIPSVVYEMGAAGLPAFATYEWGIPEVLPAEMGLTGDLATDVVRLRSFIDHELESWDSAGWADRYASHSYDQLALSYLRLYEELASG